MKTPSTGTISPTIVAVAISHGSSIRRRASLYTHHTVAIQKTSAKKISRFRITNHVPELKKSCTPPKVEAAITGSSFLPSTQQETRLRRLPPGLAPRKGTRSACRGRSPSYVLFLVDVGQEVEGAGDEDGARGARQLPGALQRPARIRLDVDAGELALRQGGELGRRQDAPARGLGDNDLVGHDG